MNKAENRKALKHDLRQQIIRGNRGCFLLAVTATLWGAGMNLALSWMMQQLTDTAMGSSASYSLRKLAMISVLILVGCILSSVLLWYSKPRFLAKAMEQYKNYAFQELVKKNISSFQKENSAVYISALSNDAASIEKNCLEKLFTLMSDLLLFAGAFVMMFCYSPKLTAAAVGFSLLPVLASLMSGKRLAGWEQRVSDKSSSFMSTLKDGLSGFSVIKCFRAERESLGLFAESNREMEKAKCGRGREETVIRSGASLAGAAAQMGVFLMGAYFALNGDSITPGMIIVFVQLMNFVVTPIAEVPGILANCQAADRLMEKLGDALSENLRSQGTESLETLTEGIRLEHVSFGYGKESRILKNINVCFEAGKSYAIVGASGSGKSTLLNLLMGGQENFEGKIYYDNVELRNISSEELYSFVSLIQQNVFVFNSSIQDNITMFREFPPEEIEQAISESGLLELIEEKGKNYPCGENGCNLSGGERQRISIARTLLQKSRVLLVDEATAALDARTAFRVTSSILDMKEMTRIVVTHSLEEALLKRYDGILVMKNGCIQEQGRFEELIERKGYFYALYTVAQ